MNSITSALTWVAVAAICLFALPVLAVIRLFDRTPTQLYTGRAFRVMGSWTTRINPAWNVEIGGVDPKTLEHPFVVVSNHQSVADIPTVSLLPWEMKWVGKKELFDLPVMGWMMKPGRRHRRGPEGPQQPRRRCIAADAAEAPARHLGDVLCRGHALARRPREAVLRRRLPLAIEAGVPILPLAIDGTMDAIPKHGWRYNRADVRLDVLEPVPTTGLDLETTWRSCATGSASASSSTSPRGARYPAESVGRADHDDARLGAPTASVETGAGAGGLAMAVPTEMRRLTQRRAGEEHRRGASRRVRRLIPAPSAAARLRIPLAAGHCPIAQLAERQFLDLEVHGSIPCRASSGG